MNPETLFEQIETIVLDSAMETIQALGFGRSPDRKRYARSLAAGINARLRLQNLVPLKAETDWPVTVKVGEEVVEDKPFPVVIALQVQRPGAPVAEIKSALPEEAHLFPLLPLDITTSQKQPFTAAAVQSARARARALGAPTVGIVNLGVGRPRVWYQHRTAVRHVISGSAAARVLTSETTERSSLESKASASSLKGPELTTPLEDLKDLDVEI